MLITLVKGKPYWSVSMSQSSLALHVPRDEPHQPIYGFSKIYHAKIVILYFIITTKSV